MSTVVTLTPKQLQIKEFYESYRRTHGKWPSARFAGKAFGVTSLAIYQRVKVLRAKGIDVGDRQELTEPGKLTTRQKEVLRVVAQFQADNGRFPTHRDMAEELGIALNAAYRLMQVLVQKGAITGPCYAINDDLLA